MVESIVVDEALKATDGSQQMAVKRLGISRATLRTKSRTAAANEDGGMQ